MLKLKKPAAVIPQVPLKEEPKKAPKETVQKKKLGSNDYHEEFEDSVLPVDESRHIVISVKRAGELGLVALDIRQFQTSEVFTGFTKKGINIPVHLLPELLDILSEVLTNCEALDLLNAPEDGETDDTDSEGA